MSSNRATTWWIFFFFKKNTSCLNSIVKLIVVRGRIYPKNTKKYAAKIMFDHFFYTLPFPCLWFSHTMLYIIP